MRRSRQPDAPPAGRAEGSWLALLLLAASATLRCGGGAPAATGDAGGDGSLAVERIDTRDLATSPELSPPQDAAPPADTTIMDVAPPPADMTVVDVALAADTVDNLDTGPPPCREVTDCARGYNCNGGRCGPAAVSCQGQKIDYPPSGDGVYWINPAGVPLRAYCDMRQRLELCTEATGERRGVMRDATGLIYKMVSSLDVALGLCKVWAVRSEADGYPIDRDRRTNPALVRDTCQLLGFKSTGVLGNCDFGDDAGNSNCGFPVASFFRWGTLCSSCTQNNGEYDRYVLQGVMHAGDVISNWTGSIHTTCRVR